MSDAIRSVAFRPSPGGRVHHRCEQPNCPLFGVVLSVDAEVLMATEDGRIYQGWAKVKWDRYKSAETLPRAGDSRGLYTGGSVRTAETGYGKRVSVKKIA